MDLTNAARRSEENDEDDVFVVSSSKGFGKAGGLDLSSHTCFIPCMVRSGHTAWLASLSGLPLLSINPAPCEMPGRFGTQIAFNESLQGREPSHMSAP